VQATVLAGVAVVFRDVVDVFGAGFDRDCLGFLFDERRVPGGGHADGLREDGGDAVGDAVQAFVAVAVGGDAEARDGGGVGEDVGGLFFQGHSGDEIGGAGFGGLRGVFAKLGCGGAG